MNTTIIGAAGFIGTNLALNLGKSKETSLTLVDAEDFYFDHIRAAGLSNVRYVADPLTYESDLDRMVEGSDVVYHLFSTSNPSNSNRKIADELQGNVIFSSNLFEACGRQKVKKVVFISSGGTIYGKDTRCPCREDSATDPITSYGLQKLTIEKLMYLCHYIYGFDYKIIRLSNPFGPYQRPNGLLGVVTTFIYKALKREKLSVYGDGSVVRDFIFIDDVIRGIQQIVNGNSDYHVFNLGSGYGISVKQVIETISRVLKTELDVEYTPARNVDVPINYLDIGRYEKAFGALNPLPLEMGIEKTADFLRSMYLND